MDDIRAQWRKLANSMSTDVWFTGELQVSETGWCKLKVPQALVDGLYSACEVPGLKQPEYGAHISVMTRHETAELGNIRERGKNFRFRITGIRSVKPAGWPEMSRAYFAICSSPELQKLRESYGLTGKIKGDHPFHITFAVKPVRVKESQVTEREAKSAGLQDTVQNLEKPDPEDPEREQRRKAWRRNIGWLAAFAGTAAGGAVVYRLMKARAGQRAAVLKADLKPDVAVEKRQELQLPNEGQLQAWTSPEQQAVRLVGGANMADQDKAVQDFVRKLQHTVTQNERLPVNSVAGDAFNTAVEDVAFPGAMGSAVALGAKRTLIDPAVKRMAMGVNSTIGAPASRTAQLAASPGMQGARVLKGVKGLVRGIGPGLVSGMALDQADSTGSVGSAMAPSAVWGLGSHMKAPSVYGLVQAGQAASDVADMAGGGTKVWDRGRVLADRQYPERMRSSTNTWRLFLNEFLTRFRDMPANAANVAQHAGGVRGF